MPLVNDPSLNDPMVTGPNSILEAGLQPEDIQKLVRTLASGQIQQSQINPDIATVIAGLPPEYLNSLLPKQAKSGAQAGGPPVFGTGAPSGGKTSTGNPIVDALLKAGSSGSSSSSGSSKVDPMVSAGTSLYFKLWGEMPPKGYIASQLSGGLNLFELEAQERAKPAFRNTRTYRDEESQYGSVLASALGER